MNRNPQTIIAIITTNPDDMAKIRAMPDTEVELGFLDDEGLWTGENVLDMALEALEQQTGAHRLQPGDLEPAEVTAVVSMVCGSKYWVAEGELYRHRIHEVLEDHPQLKAKLYAGQEYNVDQPSERDRRRRASRTQNPAKRG